VRTVRRCARVPYSSDQMFALVNDIAAYPQFLPWCKAAVVTFASDDVLEATLDVGAGALHKRFSTRNSLQRPRRIDIDLIEGPFKSLAGGWRFDPVDGGGCDVSLALDFEVASLPLKIVFERVFEELVRSQMDAFLKRASQVYA